LRQALKTEVLQVAVGSIQERNMDTVKICSSVFVHCSSVEVVKGALNNKANESRFLGSRYPPSLGFPPLIEKSLFSKYFIICLFCNYKHSFEVRK